MTNRASTGNEVVPRIDRTCPHCGHQTQVFRSTGPLLPGGLRLDEFQALVRAEWRRQLGPEAYGRAHEGAMIRSLARLSENPNSAVVRAQLRQEVWTVVADVLATGAGRQEVRREMAKLIHSVRAVLRKAGVDATTVEEAYVRPAREAIFGLLDYPPIASDDPMEEEGDGEAA